MAYKFTFADNGIYGASDINKITSRLVTKGVGDSFKDGMPYNLSSLNEIGARLYTSGAVPETVNTLKVAKRGSDTVTISPGVAFFQDGAVIEILSGGETLSFTAGKKNYVYLKNDLENTNTCYPACTESAPTGDFVSLAEIETDGTITDTRTYAKGKVPGYASDAFCVLKIEDTYHVALTNNSGNMGTATFTKTYDVGNHHCSFLMSQGKGEWTQYYTYQNGYLGIYNFSDNSHFSYYTANNDASYVKNKLCLHKSGNGSRTLLIMADVTFQDGILTLSVTCTEEYTSYANTYDIPITLYLF